MRWLLLQAASLGAAGWAVAAEPKAELPISDGEFLDGLPALIDPGMLPEAPAGGATPLTVEAAKEKVEEARRKLARWQKLAKSGVISLVEVEGCEVDVAKAEVAVRKAQLAEAKTGTPENVQSCEQQCREAEDALARLRLLLAERNVVRYRKLVAARLATKSELARAEALAARLQAALPPKP